MKAKYNSTHILARHRKFIDAGGLVGRTPVELALMHAFLRHVDKEGKAWPCNKLLSRETGFSIPTVIKGKKRLTEQNPRFMKCVRKGSGRHKSNKYRVLPEISGESDSDSDAKTVNSQSVNPDRRRRNRDRHVTRRTPKQKAPRTSKPRGRWRGVSFSRDLEGEYAESDQWVSERTAEIMRAAPELTSEYFVRKHVRAAGPRTARHIAELARHFYRYPRSGGLRSPLALVITMLEDPKRAEKRWKRMRDDGFQENSEGGDDHGDWGHQ